MKKLFKSEFERRLFALRDAINEYEKTGKDISLIPRLFACVSFCWCKNPKLNNK